MVSADCGKVVVLKFGYDQPAERATRHFVNVQRLLPRVLAHVHECLCVGLASSGFELHRILAISGS